MSGDFYQQWVHLPLKDMGPSCLSSWGVDTVEPVLGLLVLCSGRSLSLQSLFSSSTTVDPNRSRPGAVSPGNKALMP